jgi:hypothetical protein
MHHLTLEELARLVDEAPADEERAHLESCQRCAAELDSLLVQTGLLSQLPDPVLPQPVHLRIKEGLLAETGAPAGVARNYRWLPAAAGIALFVLGGALGTFGIAPRLGGPRSAAVAAPPETSGPVDAASSLAAAEAEYLRALAEFAEFNYSTDGLDPLNRLAALEGIVLTTRAALREAPADPVINNYHLTALGQRDALLRQLEEVRDTLEWF